MHQIVHPAEAKLGLTHDLRNLLQTATAAIRIIDRGTNKRSRRVDDAIVGARTSLERAIELAALSFDENYLNSVRPKLADVAQCLDDVRSILEVTNTEAVQVDVEIGKKLGLVSVDPLSLQNAVLNLAFNALEAVAGAGQIKIAGRSINRGSIVEIRVIDNGVGMTRETINRAFDRGFTTKCEGLGGIGLATVESIVRAALGTISIDSEHGIGTTVTVRLPTARRSRKAEEGR